ncbi:MAG TPA: isochorismatase family protein [Acidimicrobiales bacterium]|nr:isochorismatase family protein [Acidimicrobiales bacterium]
MTHPGTTGATALVVVDAQRNMLVGAGAAPEAAELRGVLGELLARARARARDAGAAVVHVQNDGAVGEPDEPGTDGWELAFAPADGELVVRKSVSDTFAANPPLAAELWSAGVRRLVVVGLQSEYCVRATSLGALGAGFAVLLPSEAHATYGDGAVGARAISDAAEQELAAAGVSIVRAAEVAFGPAPHVADRRG